MFEFGTHSDEFIKGSKLCYYKSWNSSSQRSYAANKKENIPVISELELTNRESKTPFIIITGTNGKTTTTALTEHILSKSLNVKACGNIGQPQVILPIRI